MSGGTYGDGDERRPSVTYENTPPLAAGLPTITGMPKVGEDADGGHLRQH